MSGLRFAVGGFFFAETFFPLRFGREGYGRIALLVDDVEDARDGDRVAGLHFLERHLKRHALDDVEALLKATADIGFPSKVKK